jgi:hypothetical protein
VLWYLHDLADGPLSEDQVRAIAAALIDVADDFEERKGLIGMLTSPFLLAIEVLTEVLGKVKWSERGPILRDALKNPRSVEFPVKLIESLTEQTKSNTSKSRIDAEDAAKLKDVAAELIRRKFEANEIPVRAQTAYILYAWLRLAPEHAPKDIKGITSKSDERFLWFVRRFAKVSVARAMHPVPLDLKGLEPVFSADELDARLATIEGSESRHSADAKELRGLLKQAVDGPEEANDGFDLSDDD